MKEKDLTDKQAEVLQFMMDNLVTITKPPSIRAIARHFNISTRAAFDRVRYIRKALGTMPWEE